MRIATAEKGLPVIRPLELQIWDNDKITNYKYNSKTRFVEEETSIAPFKIYEMCPIGTYPIVIWHEEFGGIPLNKIKEESEEMKASDEAESEPDGAEMIDTVEAEPEKKEME